MSAMTRLALPPQQWTLAHTAGGTNVAITIHGHPEILMNVGASAPSADLLVAPYVAFRAKREPFTVDAGDKVYLFNNSPSSVDATVWA